MPWAAYFGLAAVVVAVLALVIGLSRLDWRGIALVALIGGVAIDHRGRRVVPQARAAARGDGARVQVLSQLHQGPRGRHSRGRRGVDGSGVPHCAQKRLVATFSAMQLGQRIWCPSGANRSLSTILQTRWP